MWPGNILGRPGDISEDHIFPEMDERHGVIKSPSEEEEKEKARQKQEAFIALAAQLDDQVDIVAVVEPPGSPDQG